MREEDREIWVGKNRFYLGDDDILYGTVVGDVDEKMAPAFKEAILTMISKAEGKGNILIDLNRVGQPSLEARKIGQQTFKDEKVGKVALFGMHPVARVIASFVIGVTTKKDIRFFKSKDEALVWLKE